LNMGIHTLWVLACFERMAGTTGLEPATSAVTGRYDVYYQVLRSKSREHLALKGMEIHSREFLLFPDCSRVWHDASESENQILRTDWPDAQRVRVKVSRGGKRSGRNSEEMCACSN